MSELAGILARLAERLGPAVGAPVPLDGGITNRNFRVTLGGREYVLRLPGKDTGMLGIDREAERLATERASELGIGPVLAYADAECSVTEFVTAQAVDPDRLKADPGSFARALHAFHDSGLRLPNRFWIPSLLAQYAEPISRGRSPFSDRFAHTRTVVGRIAEVLPLDNPVPCHDDLLPGNLLMDAGGAACLVDWEYAGMGHRLFDLGNLAVNNDFDDAAEDRLIEAYFGAPAIQSRRAAIKLMKIVSDAREAAWGVVQGLISDLDFDFAGYAEHHFDRLESACSGGRLEELLDAAAT